MKMFEVLPGIGVGPVRLGMSRDEARHVMGGEPACFDKAGTSRYETDAFCDNGFQIYYEGDDPRVEFIDLSEGCGFVASYRDRDVFMTRATELVEFIAEEAPYDDTHPEPGHTFLFPGLELSLWRQVMRESEDDPEGQFFMTVGIGIKGYFTNHAGENP